MESCCIAYDYAPVLYYSRPGGTINNSMEHLNHSCSRVFLCFAFTGDRDRDKLKYNSGQVEERERERERESEAKD